MHIFDAHNYFQANDLYSFIGKGAPSTKDLLDVDDSDKL